MKAFKLRRTSFKLTGSFILSSGVSQTVDTCEKVAQALSIKPISSARVQQRGQQGRLGLHVSSL
jgi:hypothetical protein